MRRIIPDRTGHTVGDRTLRDRAGFSPLSLPGLALWLDAESGALNSVSPDVPATNGQSIRCWKDRSGAALAAEQTTGSLQPTLVTGWRGGRPAISFDGVNDLLTIASSVFPMTSGARWTLFMAAEHISAGGGVIAQGPNDGLATNSSALLYRSGGTSTCYAGLGGGSSVNGGAVTSDTTAAVRSWRLGDAAFQSRRGGAVVGSNAITQPLNPSDHSSVAIGFWVAYSQMKVGEILLYNRALSDAEIAPVETWLAARYSL